MSVNMNSIYPNQLSSCVTKDNTVVPGKPVVIDKDRVLPGTVVLDTTGEDKVELSTKKNNEPDSTNKKSSGAKKVGAGIASAIYPGLGQLVNGETGKAAKYFFGGIAADVAGSVGMMALFATCPPAAVAVGCAAAITHIGLYVGSIVDAVKNADK